ncbi:hypothetical protein [Flavilitoribacter nigricans]|uniref:Uncharacterized protein n=1 Tax=Flavilitoribacter nigricans (strain ATCC 23147 / DSM 23189 / NBRC 102662 / NCIMB 1420 / SS-2) TaxID=1122177 RepID=A0A2D0N779_FLAN2|nr:hypothetical protein [Flavilitoribacter nigricans]PHN04240.1 hypothetical protein CRP01_22015 [Flavilitoribacter nigricans DSM 23189 = NBRC 102662]
MIRSIAQIISLVFHPLLIVTYMLVTLLLINPYLFGVNSISDPTSKELILRVFLSTFFIPAFSVAMLRFLGLIDSIEMKTKEERIGPYIITGVFYLWMLRNFWDNSNVPTVFTSLMLGTVIGLFIAFFFNIFTKISAHAVGMGGLMATAVISMLLFRYDTFVVNSTILGTFELSLVTLLMAFIFLAGLVGTARLILSAHVPRELYSGYIVGFCSQFLALRFLFL